MPSKPFRLRPRALQDLEEIDVYTFREFGAAQADQYIDTIFAAFQTLADNPALGRSCDYIRPGLRAAHVGSHIVFYKTTSAGLTIVRVLHKSMDYGQHV